MRRSKQPRLNPPFTKRGERLLCCTGPVAPGALATLPLPAGAGGSADVLLSFELTGTSGSGFGIAVRAPPRAYAGVAAVTMTVDHVGTPDAAGSRTVSVSFLTPNPKADHDSNANATVLLLRGETLDVRVLVDKSVVEVFLMGGRAAYVQHAPCSLPR